MPQERKDVAAVSVFWFSEYPSNFCDIIPSISWSLLEVVIMVICNLSHSPVSFSGTANGIQIGH
jgi:hypothetical protein